MSRSEEFNAASGVDVSVAHDARVGKPIPSRGGGSHVVVSQVYGWDPQAPRLYHVRHVDQRGGMSRVSKLYGSHSAAHRYAKELAAGRRSSLSQEG